MRCRDIEDRLAAYAAGGLDAREERELDTHVSACEACRAEVRELRAVLAQARAAGDGPGENDAFWQDFERGVRVACAEAPRPGPLATLWAWLRRPAVALAVCGAVAAALLVAFKLRARDDEAPGVAAPRRAPVTMPAVVVDEEDMTDEQLDAVLAALDAEIAEIEDEAEPAGDADPFEAIEELDDDELERVHDELVKGA